MKGSKACKETFPKLLTSLWVALTPEVVRSGFRGTGIVPLLREHVLSKLPAATDLEPEVVDRDSCQTVKCTHYGHDMPATPILKMRLMHKCLFYCLASECTSTKTWQKK